MAIEVKLVVMDAPPLITLAAAKSLDYLLYPELPVIIPDAVFHEATASLGKLGAQEILAWYRTNIDKVRIETTEAFQSETILLEIAQAKGRLPYDLGERAAAEIIRDRNLIRPDQRALLLSDDRDVEHFIVTDPGKIILLTTWRFLQHLEEAQRIQSADAVMELARQAGRNPPKHDLWSGHDPEVRDAVKAILAKKPFNQP